MIKFTQQAMQRWNQIPDDVRPQLLNNVYCSKCKDAVKIINFEALIDEDSDLILKGSCARCNNNVTRLIEDPADNYLNQQIELSIDDGDDLIDKQINENEKLIQQFEVYLTSQNLSPKTIKKHCDNVDFFLNTYSTREEILKLKDTIIIVNDYFSYFLPFKTMFGSVNDTKTQITSLKKFYKYLLDINILHKNDYDCFLLVIKENKQNWFDVYDNEDMDDDC